MPDATELRLSHLFTKMLGRDVKFNRIETRTESAAKQIYFVYNRFDQEVELVVKGDLPLLASFAGAFLGFQDSDVQSRISSSELDDVLKDAIFEILNMASSAVSHHGPAILSKMATSFDEIGKEAESMVASPHKREVYNVAVEGYKGGRLTVLS
jgi:hypothetical protein